MTMLRLPRQDAAGPAMSDVAGPGVWHAQLVTVTFTATKLFRSSMSP
jgi:hypothetical protein